jgi:import inner membrane translocase subunit TIM44
MSEALTEICKMDPDFSKEEFLKKCEFDIIPNVLEAMARGDLDILKDWCHEGPFNILSTPIKHALSLGNFFSIFLLNFILKFCLLFF